MLTQSNCYKIKKQTHVLFIVGIRHCDITNYFFSDFESSLESLLFWIWAKKSTVLVSSRIWNSKNTVLDVTFYKIFESYLRVQDKCPGLSYAMNHTVHYRSCQNQAYAKQSTKLFVL